MGGSPVKIIKKAVSSVVGGGGDSSPPAKPTSDITERRDEVKKVTEPEGKKLVSRKIKRSRRTRASLAGDFTQTAALGAGVRNPGAGTGKTTLGA